MASKKIFWNILKYSWNILNIGDQWVPSAVVLMMVLLQLTTKSKEKISKDGQKATWMDFEGHLCFVHRALRVLNNWFRQIILCFANHFSILPAHTEQIAVTIIVNLYRGPINLKINTLGRNIFFLCISDFNSFVHISFKIFSFHHFLSSHVLSTFSFFFFLSLLFFCFQYLLLSFNKSFFSSLL